MKISDRTRTAIKSDGTIIPVVDSKFSFLVQPTKKDIENGVQGDHTKCMYALACRRLYDSDLVWVTRTLAYIELQNKKGEPVLHRFILKSPARNQVKGFDKDKEYATPEAVIFARPEGRMRLDAKLVAEAKRRTRIKSGKEKKAYVKGQAARPHRVKPLADTLRDPAFGMFHFHQNA